MPDCALCPHRCVARGPVMGGSGGLLLACGSSAVLLVVLILFALALFLLLGLLFLFDRLGGRCGAGYAVNWLADRQPMGLRLPVSRAVRRGAISLVNVSLHSLFNFSSAKLRCVESGYNHPDIAKIGTLWLSLFVLF